MCDDFGMHAPKQKPSPLIIVLFVMYLVLLAWTILWKLEAPYVGAAALLPRPVKFVPFFPSGDADGSAPAEVALNVLLFVPFGFYLGLLAPSWRWWKPLLVFSGASLALEVIQYLISVGTADVTDVISNTLGGVAGLALIRLLVRILTTTTLARICVVFTVLSVVAAAAFIASPIRLMGPHDVIFPSPTAVP